MKPTKRPSDNDRDNAAKPYFMAGSGDLESSVWKTGSDAAGSNYRFTIYKLLRSGGVTQKFRPSELRKIIKLARVLAAVFLDDGCVSPKERREFTALSRLLEEVEVSMTESEETSKRHRTSEAESCRKPLPLRRIRYDKS